MIMYSGISTKDLSIAAALVTRWYNIFTYNTYSGKADANNNMIRNDGSEVLEATHDSSDEIQRCVKKFIPVDAFLLPYSRYTRTISVSSQQPHFRSHSMSQWLEFDMIIFIVKSTCTSTTPQLSERAGADACL